MDGVNVKAVTVSDMEPDSEPATLSDPVLEKLADPVIMDAPFPIATELPVIIS
jgi:hypothetical protein